ncbi:ABC transporter ATP-binding protein [Bifidobacterium indicum]|uniref:ABC transporter ATP-binding protein n=1 Tax=Bifidobacterium indicum TaxID=1691 RepID=UPI00263321B7|nr:ABC transporter ATP-binding protein [uncultured Bifidobacterium sp.]
MDIIALENVSYRYSKQSRMVLGGINAGFRKGDLTCIMGRSGAGKTTLLSLLAGLDTASGGRVLYMGADLADMDRDRYRARQIGTVFQGYNLLNRASAVENIVLSMQISGVKDRRKTESALALLERVGIDGTTARRQVSNLSGGEQQRVGIARALAHDPVVIIADEPTGSLDGETRTKIMDILVDLAHNDDKCVIVVTHSKSVAKRADELWNLNWGTLKRAEAPAGGTG